MTRSTPLAMVAGLGLLAPAALPEGVPVVLGVGMEDGRTSAIFGSPAELDGFVDETC